MNTANSSRWIAAAIALMLLLSTLGLVLEATPIWWQSVVAAGLAAIGAVVTVVDSANRYPTVA